MPLLFLLLFIGTPIIEIAVFIQAGDLIGLWPTLAIVLITGVAGTFLLRTQGYGVIGRIRTQVDAGEPPLFEMFEGLCIFAAGLLLLTPGFVTDSIGFLLFLPPFRRLIAGVVARRVKVQVQGGGFHGSPHGGQGPGGTHPRGGPDRGQGGGPIIDGEYETVDPDRDKLR
ncbi:MAG: FxsA family protein [Minwuia sp.]|nr:FxsA family protein [Minwuia sp.]